MIVLAMALHRGPVPVLDGWILIHRGPVPALDGWITLPGTLIIVTILPWRRTITPEADLYHP